MTPDPAAGPAAAEELVRRLVEDGALSEAALERARRAAETVGGRLDRVLLDLGLVSEDRYLAAAGAALGLPLALPQQFPEEPVLPTVLKGLFLRHAKVLPLVDDGTALQLAVADPFDDFSPAAIAAKTGRRVERRLAATRDLGLAFDRLYAEGRTGEAPRGEEMASGDVERLRDLAGDAPVIRLVNHLIETAIELAASDIHLTAAPEGTRLRYRVDGMLRTAEVPASALHAALVSRIKIMAGLDIAERRLPQDGHVTIVSRGRAVDLRVATMPHAAGEGVVLRLLDRDAVVLEFPALGLSPRAETGLRRALAQPHGLVLVTGPTGSGKTTTLYTALKAAAGPERNIVTVEDPIEYRLDGVNQIQVVRKIGFEFATALRAILRQDPDVIMIGEIRDGETARVAIQAALTGHLVLATLHTNSAAGAITRLVDMGVEPYLIASTIEAALAQRLVRRRCPACAARDAFGCEDCGGTGYRGRVALTEFLEIDESLRDLVRGGADERRLHEAAVARGMPDLRADGAAKVAAGLTTRAELDRVLGRR